MRSGAADDRPLNLPPDDEDISQDPDDWER
jgi:hypothetical protein